MYWMRCLAYRSIAYRTAPQCLSCHVMSCRVKGMYTYFNRAGRFNHAYEHEGNRMAQAPHPHPHHLALDHLKVKGGGSSDGTQWIRHVMSCDVTACHVVLCYGMSCRVMLHKGIDSVDRHTQTNHVLCII